MGLRQNNVILDMARRCLLVHVPGQTTFSSKFRAPIAKATDHCLQLGYVSNKYSDVSKETLLEVLSKWWSPSPYGVNEIIIDNTNDPVLTFLRFLTLSPLDVVDHFSRFRGPPLKIVLLMRTHFDRGEVLKLEMSRGRLKAVVAWVPRRCWFLLSSWHGGKTLGSVKVDGAHHRSVLKDALSHLLGWHPSKRRGNITVLDEFQGSVQ